MDINVVVPMAGYGSRFKEVGYSEPKPFIKINGVSMVELVLQNLMINNATYILIVLAKHINQYAKFFSHLKMKYNIIIVPVIKTTQGAACTVLKACEYINNTTPLMIANSDQIVDIKVNDFVNDAHNKQLCGSIMTFKSNDPKWSYAKVSEDNFVTSVKEKDPISDNATVGIYYFAQGKYYVNGAVEMIVNKEMSKNEYYVCPVYNYVISSVGNVGIYEISSNKMHGLGTPRDLNIYLKESALTEV